SSRSGAHRDLHPFPTRRSSDLSPGTGVHVARVRVDPETGRVEPIRYVVVQDVGKAINPATVEEQIHGGGAQGVGWAIYEEIVHEDRKSTRLNSSHRTISYAVFC